MNKTLRDRLPWMLEHWRLYCADVPLLAILTLANAAVSVAYPYVIKLIVDGMTTGAAGDFFLNHTLLLVGIGVAHFVVYLNMQLVRMRLNLSFEYGVRLRGIEYLTRMGHSFFNRFRIGDIVTRLMDDVNEKLSWYMCSGIFRVFEASAIIFFGIIMMLSISPKLTLCAAGPLPLLVLVFMFAASRLHRRYDVVQKSISHLNEVLETCFSGIRVVKAFTAEPMQRTIFGNAIEANRVAEVRAVRWQSILDTLWGNIWQLGIIIVLLVGGTMAMAGEVSLGDLVAFDTYVLMLVWPMFDIGQFFVRGKLSAVSIDRIQEIEQWPAEVAQPNQPMPVARKPGQPAATDYEQNARTGGRFEVRLQQVHYRYPGTTHDALSDVSFVAPPGQLTALVGETGAGKSTALAIISRLFDPDSGQVAIEGPGAADWDLDAAGALIQGITGTILDNIRFGRQWVSDADVQMALEVAQLSDELRQWPDGIDTVVGSRGLRLSGGQRQRVALARALAGRPPILLLDDCTASLDIATEDAIWRRLPDEIPDCNILLVTHRPSTLQRAGKILVFDEGRLCESGTFDELNSHDTFFHQMYIQWKLRERTTGR